VWRCGDVSCLGTRCLDVRLGLTGGRAGLREWFEVDHELAVERSGDALEADDRG